MIYGIIGWIVIIAGAIYVFGYRKVMKNRIAKEGIETKGVISRISENLDTDTMNTSYSWYVEYYDEFNERHEALVIKPDYSLDVGDEIRIKYHSSNYRYAEYVGKVNNNNENNNF